MAKAAELEPKIRQLQIAIETVVRGKPEAVKLALPQLRGAFALAIAFRQHPDMLIGARLGSPLVLGYGEGETYLGSDALALAPLTQKISYLDEGDWVVITRDGTRIFDRDNQPVERDIAVMYRRNKPHSGPMSAFLDLLGEIYGMKLPR